MRRNDTLAGRCKTVSQTTSQVGREYGNQGERILRSMYLELLRKMAEVEEILTPATPQEKLKEEKPSEEETLPAALKPRATENPLFASWVYHDVSDLPKSWCGGEENVNICRAGAWKILVMDVGKMEFFDCKNDHMTPLCPQHVGVLFLVLNDEAAGSGSLQPWLEAPPFEGFSIIVPGCLTWSWTRQSREVK